VGTPIRTRFPDFRLRRNAFGGLPRKRDKTLPGEAVRLEVLNELWERYPVVMLGVRLTIRWTAMVFRRRTA
jgi:hypothetical protein